MYFRLSSLLKLKCALRIFLKSWKAWGLTVHSSDNIYWLCIWFVLFFFFFSWQILNFWINTGDTWRIFTLFDSNLPCPHCTAGSFHSSKEAFILHTRECCIVAATSCMYFRLSSLLKLKCALRIFLKSWKAWGLTVHSSDNIYWLCIWFVLFFFFFSWQILNFWINTGDTWRIFTLFDSNLPCPHCTAGSFHSSKEAFILHTRE